MIPQRIIHRRAAQAAIVLVCATVALVTVVQLTGGGAHYAPEGERLAKVDLLFTDETDGDVLVTDAATGAEVARYGENEGVFVRAVMRTVARQRRMRDQGPETPVRLARYEGDRLWLSDPVSGVEIFLGAFGTDNEAAFAALLDADPEIRTAQATEAAR